MPFYFTSLYVFFTHNSFKIEKRLREKYKWNFEQKIISQTYTVGTYKK